MGSQLSVYGHTLKKHELTVLKVVPEGILFCSDDGKYKIYNLDYKTLRAKPFYHMDLVYKSDLKEKFRKRLKEFKIPLLSYRDYTGPFTGYALSYFIIGEKYIDKVIKLIDKEISNPDYASAHKSLKKVVEILKQKKYDVYELEWS
jgi:hypothetical protein